MAARRAAVRGQRSRRTDPWLPERVPKCLRAGALRSTPCPVTRRLPCDRHRSPARCAADRPAQRRLGPAPPRTPAAAATCAVAPAGALPHGHRPRPALSSAAASREHCTAPQKPSLATVLPRCSIPAAPRPPPRGSPDCGRTSGASGPALRPPSVRTRTRRADESRPGTDRYRGRSRARARLPQSHPRRRPRHTLVRPDPVAARPEPRLSPPHRSLFATRGRPGSAGCGRVPRRAPARARRPACPGSAAGTGSWPAGLGALACAFAWPAP